MFKCTFIGNLGADCVVNQVNGKQVINFTAAHTDKFKGADGVEKETTTWISASWFTDNQGIVPYLKKGKQIYLEGQPLVRSYNRQDGTPGVSLDVKVFNVQLLGGAEQQQAAAPAAQPAQGFYPAQPATTPFQQPGQPTYGPPPPPPQPAAQASYGPPPPNGSQQPQFNPYAQPAQGQPPVQYQQPGQPAPGYGPGQVRQQDIANNNAGYQGQGYQAPNGALPF